MNIWLCCLKVSNWRLAKRHGVLGFSKRQERIVRMIRKGDILLIYTLTTRGIVAVCKVTSEVYEDQSKLWSNYPLRVNFQVLSKFKCCEKRPVRFRSSISPLFLHTSCVRISEAFFEKLFGTEALERLLHPRKS